MAIDYPFQIDGTDFSHMVERDSYATTLTPVYSSAITTLDGVDHMVLIREKGGISAQMNPQTAEDTAALCSALLAGPVEIFYHCLIRNQDRYATMVADSLTAQHLSQCRYRNRKWNDIGTIKLKEL